MRAWGQCSPAVDPDGPQGALEQSSAAKEIFEVLKRERIYVRYFNQPRIDGYLRITVGTEKEMEALFRFLETYLKNH